MGKLEVSYTKIEQKRKSFDELRKGEYFQFSAGVGDLYMKTDQTRGYIRAYGQDGVGNTYTTNNVATRVYDVDIKMEVSVVV